MASHVEVVPLAAEAAARTTTQLDVAVIDAGPDAEAVVAVAQALLAKRPELPLAALMCCPQSTTPWDLRRLVAAGVTSVLGIDADPAETARALGTVAQGGSVVNLHLRREQRAFLRETLVEHEPRASGNTRLLQLVARGLSDQQIGADLYLSPHTVKKHIEQLRSEVGARNRTELAAWAGRHGLYAPERAPRQTA